MPMRYFDQQSVIEISDAGHGSALYSQDNTLFKKKHEHRALGPAFHLCQEAEK